MASVACRNGMKMHLGISRLSIRGRLILLAVSLLTILILAVGYLTHQLINDSQALGSQARVAEQLKIAGQAEKHFGDFKYWLEEYAVSLLDESQVRAAAAQREFDEDLKALSIIDAASVARIEAELAELQNLSLQATQAYGTNQRGAGNALMTQSREHVRRVDHDLALTWTSSSGGRLPRATEPPIARAPRSTLPSARVWRRSCSRSCFSS
ncbi:MAG TPA: hypothetical protein VE224_05805 [Pseudolabrys sp.]|nr:hypothetical protein [Pseudolabrys sp.]